MKRDKLEGREFGQLNVLEYVGDGKYRCLCSCGKECIIYGNNLKAGHTKSCGCKKCKDISKQRFGKLVAVERVSGSGERQKWRCRCDCGNMVDIRMDSLISDFTKSCGHCGKRELPEKLKQQFIDGTQPEKIGKMTKSNVSGIVGVNWDKSRGKWQASIRYKGRKANLGRFDHIEDACKAREKAEQEILAAIASGVEWRKK